MNLKLYTGSCHCVAAQIATRLELIDGATVEIVDNALPADERGMTPIVHMSLDVDGQMLEGYDEIIEWMDQFHQQRVLDRANRQFRETLVPVMA